MTIWVICNSIDTPSLRNWWRMKTVRQYQKKVNRENRGMIKCCRIFKCSLYLHEKILSIKPHTYSMYLETNTWLMSSKFFRWYVLCGAPSTRTVCRPLFLCQKKEELKEKVYYLLQLRTMAPSYYPDTTKWRMERRCCLLNIIGAHSLDSILLPSDLRLRLFCLILRPLCRPMPTLAFACYAAVLLYISTILGNSQASNQSLYFDSTMDSNPFWRPVELT